QIEQAIRHALEQEARSWEIEQPVPPKVIWHNTLDRIADMCCAALRYPLEGLPAQKSWTEVPFGAPDTSGRNLPWDPGRAGEIPGTRNQNPGILRPPRPVRQCRAGAGDRLQDREAGPEDGRGYRQRRRRAPALPLCVCREDAGQPGDRSPE